MNDLLFIQALLGYWSETAHRGLLPLSPKRICDDISALGGITVLVYARWYPAELLLYAGGIAAVAAQRYENLRDLMLVPVKYPLGDLGEEPILLSAVVQAMLQLDRLQAFESLPGLSKHYTPRSNYLHGFLAPILEEALFIGSNYEDAFDRFEALYALEHDHRHERESCFNYGALLEGSHGSWAFLTSLSRKLKLRAPLGADSCWIVWWIRGAIQYCGHGVSENGT